MRVLAIDAWRNDGSWTWNNWSTVGNIDAIPSTKRAILKLLRKEFWLANGSKGRVAIDDDGYNLVILNKSTGEPLVAIEYAAVDQESLGDHR